MDPSFSYASAAEYKAEMQKERTSEDAGITRDLIAISRIVDRKTHRFFGKDDAPVARYYYPHARAFGPRIYGMRPVGWAESENPWRWAGAMRMLATDDMAEVPTQIVIDQDGNGSFDGDPDLDLGQLELMDLNAAANGRPYTAIVCPDWSTIGGFSVDKKVMVVCRWGWPAVPEAITRATIDLTGILRLESPRATRTVTALDSVLTTTKAANDILRDIVHDYGRGSGLFSK